MDLPKRSERAEMVRAVIAEMDEAAAWDHIQAKDLDPRIIDYVADRLSQGVAPGDVCHELSLNGGKSSRQWKKIQAYFRQGFRADAEAYLMQQTHRFYKVIERAREVLEDAFENGTPHVDKEGNVRYVRGATKELGSFLEAYSRSIALPVKLWKDFGAIGERRDLGPQGVTIVVNNSIPFPTTKEVEAHQEEMKAKMQAIEVKKAQCP